MTKEAFWSKIIITKDEKRKSIFFLKYRGIDEHDYVRKYLESVTGRKILYSEIATAFRYDKRIRRVVYKYIGFLEERIRAFIANKYSDSIKSINIIQEVQNKLDDGNPLFIALDELTFKPLINQTKKLSNADKLLLFPFYTKNIQHMSMNLNAVVQLRNEVSHNRFLLDSKRLLKCYVGDKNVVYWCKCRMK